MEMWSRMNDLTMDEAMKFEDYDAKIYIKQHPIFALERKLYYSPIIRDRPANLSCYGPGNQTNAARSFHK
jgi:hypothetical protein